MDPFSAIGVAGNIVGFLDVGFKLLAKAREIQASSNGEAAANESLVSLAKHFQQVTTSLRAQKVTGAAAREELAIQELAAECDGVAIELLELVHGLRARTSKSKRESLRAAFREWRKRDQKDELKLRLDSCRLQLNLQLTSLMRSETLARLDKLITFGKASESELNSLNRCAEHLRLVDKASFINPDALKQIHSLLSLTNTAVLRVRQARVLESLRFQLMNERFEDVEEAHEHTFDWIFDSDAVGVKGISSRSSQDSFATTDSNSSEDHDQIGRDTGARQESKGRHHNPPRSLDKDELGTALSLSSSQDNHEWIRSPPPHSATLSIEHEHGSIGKNVSMDETGDSESREDDGCSSIVSYTEIERVTSADEMSILSEGQISQPPTPPPHTPGQPGPFSPSRAQDVPDELWQVMKKARDDFTAWLERDHGIFHISGKPGSGKSTLMKYLYKHSKTRNHLRTWAGGEELSVGGFFFWRPGSALQKSIKGLVRGLLHAVLAEASDMIPVVFPAQWEESMFNDKIHIGHLECQQGFNLITSMNFNFRTHKFAFFIDGLDEFDGNHSDLVRQLFYWVTNTRNVKLCVSSRDWAVFREGFQDCPQFNLHQLTRSDMQRVVRDRFHQLNIDGLGSETIEAGNRQTHLLEDDVVEKSDGVFLWLSIVLRHFEEGVINGDDVQDLINITDSLPTELEPMFQNLLDSIPRSNLKLAFAILSFALFTRKHVNLCYLMHFSFVEDYLADKEFAMLMQPARANLMSASDNKTRLRKARRRVYGVCKGFLELRKRYSSRRPRVIQITDMMGECVRLSHRSIVEFLESGYFTQRRDVILPNFNSWDAYLQTYLGLLSNVDLPEFYFAPSPRSEDRVGLFFNAQTKNTTGKICKPLCLFTRGLDVNYSPCPSFRGDLTTIMLLHFNFVTTTDSLRFCYFLCQVRRVICDLGMHTASSRISSIGNDYIRCNPSELVVLLAAGMGLYEYILHEQDLPSAMIERCIRMCLSNFHFDACRDIREIERGIECMFKTLGALFDRGGPPDLQTFAGYPSFHTFLSTTCVRNFARNPEPPVLGIIAFMLYHGSNPEFSIALSRKPLKVSNSEVSFAESLVQLRLLLYKASFRSNTHAPRTDVEEGGSCRVLEPGKLLEWVLLSCSTCGWPKPPGETKPQRPGLDPLSISDQARKARHRLVLQVPEHIRDTLDQLNHRLDLRTLVSVWFPHQAENLQKVIDRILEMGVPLNMEQRLQLKLEFGDLLRPYFDQAHPDFPGWFPETFSRSSPDLSSQTSEPHESLFSGFQFQIHHLNPEHLDRKRSPEPPEETLPAEQS